MDVLRQLPHSTPAGAAVTFGNFDGVHVGHRALIATVCREAARLGGPATVVTFEPHPLRLLRPELAPPLIDALPVRLALFAELGVDRAVVLTFDAELANRSADWFARQALVTHLGARCIVTGPDVHFGNRGAGDLGLLEQALAEVGGHVVTCGSVSVEGAPVSSSRVRAAVTAGDLPLARTLLGRPFCLRGEVVHGDARGRTLGFPTANVDTGLQVLPAHGVYAARANVGGGVHDAVVNVGRRPTFAGADVRVEAHLLDGRDHALYGHLLELDMRLRLRDERRFDGLAALLDQIGRDVEHAREVLRSDPPEASSR
jgi:riboflavin kinase/FMN adenylyltransferase